MAAKVQLESQKLPCRPSVSTCDRDFTGRSGDREFCEGENAFFGSEDRNKKYFLRGEQSAFNLQAAARNPKIWARTTPDLPISLLIPKVLGTSYQHDSSPRRSLDVAPRRYGSFCKGTGARQPRLISLCWWGSGGSCRGSRPTRS
jgi:hypothetical protein